MKKQIFIIAAILILSTTSAIYAQSNTIKAEIPFDFNVKNETYSAGEYTIKQSVADNGQSLVWTLNNDEKQIAILAMTTQSKEREDKPSMTFNRYGNQYFLSKFVTQRLKIALRTSKSEKRAKRVEGKKLAKVNNPRSVTIEATIE